MRGTKFGRASGVALVALLILGNVAEAQKDKKKKGESQPQSAMQAPRAPESNIIDYAISEMLGAWQIGDTIQLKKHFSDNVIVVSGVYEPALVGWANYEPAYRRQRERMTEVRLERKNTFIVVRGNTAWATFNYEFSAMVDGRPMMVRGQWSLVLEKPADSWVVTLNHTSVTDQRIPEAPPPAQNPPAQSKPPARPRR
jgi:ketosteroid isomerase-like protein